MKKLFTLVSIILAMVVSSCTYDDTAVWNKLENHESRISALEELCREMNTNISALQSLVDAMQGGDYITSIVPVTKDGNTIGYTITFAENDPITIYHGTNGKDGANGADGKDGYTPIIGVKQDSDGIYYWTLDGEWLLDDSGNKIRAVGTDGKDGQDGANGADGTNGNDGANGNDGKDGVDAITPQLKIEEGYWYVSYDKGASWTQLGKATGEDGQDGANGADGVNGDAFFANVTVGEDSVTFTLADGTVITLPLAGAEGGDDSGDIVAGSNKIYYTTADNKKMFPTSTEPSAFGAILISNEYKDGQGILTFDDTITSIGKDAFSDCTALTSITIPDSVTSIGNEAFDNCDSLTSVTIPDSVTEIGSSAFYHCDSLTNVTIGNGVTSIGSYAFSDCTSLTSVTIPDSVTTIVSYAFEDCTSLTSVTIGNGVTSIGKEVFENCTSLTSVDITDIEAWCKISFAGDTSNPLYCAHNLYLNGELVTDLVIPDSVTSIVDYTFYNCTSLTSVTIPDSVTEIGKWAFRDCSSLTSVTIPDSVTSIGDSAFYGCTGELIVNSKIIETDYSYDNRPANGSSGWLYGAEFTKLTIGDIIAKIGDYTFYNCTSLTSVIIPDSVTSIGERAFYNCSSLKSVTIPDSVTSIESSAFCGCSSLTSVNIPDSITSIGDYAFGGCSSLTSVTIPDSVTSIGNSAFSDCTSLESITIPDSVTEIGDYTFYMCTSLESVTIPDSVTEIGDYAFAGCKSLTRVDITDIEAWCKISFVGGYSNPLYYAHNLYLNGELVTDLVIPDSVTKIENSAFGGCSSLTSVTIPDSVTSIGWYAFEGCSSLTSVYCKPTTPPAGGSCMFYSNASGREIYVPAASVEAYKSAEYWSDYEDHIVGYEF